MEVDKANKFEIKAYGILMAAAAEKFSCLASIFVRHRVTKSVVGSFHSLRFATWKRIIIYYESYRDILKHSSPKNCQSIDVNKQLTCCAIVDEWVIENIFFVANFQLRILFYGRKRVFDILRRLGIFVFWNIRGGDKSWVTSESFVQL